VALASGKRRGLRRGGANTRFTGLAYDGAMTRVLCLLLLLTGCGFTPEQLLTGAVGGVVGSIAVIHRSPFDALYSMVTGKDCSVVRLDEGKSYCRPVEPLPEPQPFCSRSLGVANCWQDPSALPDHPKEIADGPQVLTPEQEANRTRRWPNL
jgi:hypothetical protein